MRSASRRPSRPPTSIDVDAEAPPRRSTSCPTGRCSSCCRAATASPTLVRHERRRDRRRRAARLSAGRSDPRLDPAQHPSTEYGTSDASTSAVDTLDSRRRRLPRLRAPRHRPVPQPRHPGAHGRRLPASASSRWTCTPGSRPTSAAAGTPSTPPRREPRGGRIVIAYGRDAADVAFVTQFGPVELEQMLVFVREATDIPAVDPGAYDEP